MGILLYTLIRTGEALAGEQTAGTRSPLDFAAPTDLGKQDFSSMDFRPRKSTLFDRDPVAAAYDDTPMLHGTTVWQRLGDFKSHDRVRLLTLWESRGSTISLQAGRKGDPSLQWTSRLMNRGGSTRGLLDQWFSVSLANAGNRLRNASRPEGTAVPSKLTNFPVNAAVK